MIYLKEKKVLHLFQHDIQNILSLHNSYFFEFAPIKIFPLIFSSLRFFISSSLELTREVQAFQHDLQGLLSPAFFPNVTSWHLPICNSYSNNGELYKCSQCSMLFHDSIHWLVLFYLSLMRPVFCLMNLNLISFVQYECLLL